MLSFWRNFRPWLHRKLLFRQLSGSKGRIFLYLCTTMMHHLIMYHRYSRPQELCPYIYLCYLCGSLVPIGDTHTLQGYFTDTGTISRIAPASVKQSWRIGIYRWLSARLHYLQCISDGVVLHWVIDMDIWILWIIRGYWYKQIKTVYTGM